ncbi:MAG: hypothetical protein AB1847_23505 [bacterium]
MDEEDNIRHDIEFWTTVEFIVEWAESHMKKYIQNKKRMAYEKLNTLQSKKNSAQQKDIT